MNHKTLLLSVILFFACFSLFLRADFPMFGVGDDPQPDNGWQEQPIIKLNGENDTTVLEGKMRILSENWNAVAAVPSIVYMPEKKRLLLLITACGYPERSMMMESDDFGETWTKPHFTKNREGRPEVNHGIGMRYFGNGKLMFYYGFNRAVSEDYGKTWEIINKLEPTPDGHPWNFWDPPLLVRARNTVPYGDSTTLYETGCHTEERLSDDGLHSFGYHSQAYLRSSEDEGLTWSEAIKVPQWDYVNEVYLALAPNGDLVAACRTDNRTWWLDHVSGLVTCVSSDRGKTWSEPFVVFETGRHHPSIVNLPDGRMVMTYVVRMGYPDDENGFPRFGIEAVVSNDNGKTWDIDGRYILATFTGVTKGSDTFICATQSTSSVLLPDGRIFTTFGTGHRSHLHHENEKCNDLRRHGYRDVGIVTWNPLPKTNETPFIPKEITLSLPTKENNPRNSEGSFVKLKNGDILYVYTHYTGNDPDDGSPAKIVSRVSKDQGKTWSPEDRLVVEREGKRNSMSVSLLRLQDDRIALMYHVKNNQADCYPYIRFSSDEGETWSERIRCIPDPNTYNDVGNDRLIQLENGNLMFAFCRYVFLGDVNNRHDYNYAPGTRIFTSVSEDGGKTWTVREMTNPEQVPCYEPGLVRLADGRLFFWARTEKTGRQYSSYSQDDGKTWSQLQPSVLTSPPAPAMIKRIPESDRLLAFWNPLTPTSAAGRDPMHVAVLSPDGSSIEKERIFEKRSETNLRYFSYPSFIFPDARRVLVGYCAGPLPMGTTEIRLALIDLADWE